MIIDHFYDSDRDIHWYHLGSHDEPAYRQFYDWQGTKPLRYAYSDMPHDYFVYLHEADRQAMHEKFAAHIRPQEVLGICLEDFIDHARPVDVSSDEWFIANLLAEEIRREIDAQIIAETTRKIP